MASDWQNHLLIRDVDQSGLVTPLDVLILVNAINGSGIRVLPPRPIASTEPFFDVSGDGSLTPLDVLVVINAINLLNDRQPNIVGGMSPESDPNNNGVVLTDLVEIRGQTLALATVKVSIDTRSDSVTNVAADNQGLFTFDLPVMHGLQTIRMKATDELGRQAELKLDIRRGNTIQDWNAAALDIVRQWTTFSNDPYPNRIVTAQPPMVARNLAMIQTAMFDAANAVRGTYTGYLFQTTPLPNASENAAAASAGYEVGKVLYQASDEVAVWQASLNETLNQETDATARELGVSLGKLAAQSILAARNNDGVQSGSSYTPTNGFGHWQRTFPDNLPPLLAQWPNVKPFGMTSGSEFRPAPPPSLDSPEYAAAVDEVMKLGGYQSSQRTANQTEIALFWADGGGTATPPGHWNDIAINVTLAKQTNLLETARTFALMNIAMADAGIASWDAKYHYDVWRPIDAIRQADQDNNATTTSESTWIPLLKTPPFPTYT
ncbi:MAG TPA: dockerin type I domain-containing protein, partial [Pirellula sp.]|nr:dockerin type I domain-containing protein [Pirellula sp.]